MKEKVLITGASSGIGCALAVEFHGRGYDLVVVARRDDLLHELAAALESKRPDSVEVLVADIGSVTGCAQVEERLAQGDIDILVNNAGRGSFGPFETIARNAETEMVLLNAVAPLRLTHAILPRLKANRRGGILFVSSIAAFQPLPYMSTYAATKSFNFVQAIGLAAELRGFGITVTVICPGPTATDFGGVARVPGSMTNISRDSAEDVARQAIEAYLRGDMYVVTGWRSKFLALASRIVPYRISTWLIEREFRSILT